MLGLPVAESSAVRQRLILLWLRRRRQVLSLSRDGSVQYV